MIVYSLVLFINSNTCAYGNGNGCNEGSVHVSKNKTKQNKTKQNKTKQNKTSERNVKLSYYIASSHCISSHSIISHLTIDKPSIQEAIKILSLNCIIILNTLHLIKAQLLIKQNSRCIIRNDMQINNSTIMHMFNELYAILNEFGC